MILVFGHSGQVATELRLHADVVALGRNDADLTDPTSCAAAIHALRPSAVINAAAYTAVDKAEEDEVTAALVNGAATMTMAKTCAALGIPFVHISTDYVFDGAGETAFSPDAQTAPLGAYGRTKLAGEDGARAAGGAFAILRTSWVFSAYGANFVKTMLRLGSERDTLAIVADQIGGPTPAGAIASACLSIAEQLKTDPAASGVYHFSGAPDVSWAVFARTIFETAGIECAVTGIPTTAYPTLASRPLNSRLDCTETERTFAIPRPNWRASLPDIISQIRGQA